MSEKIIMNSNLIVNNLKYISTIYYCSFSLRRFKLWDVIVCTSEIALLSSFLKDYLGFKKILLIRNKWDIAGRENTDVPVLVLTPCAIELHLH